MTLQWGVFRANLDPVQGSEQAGLRPVVVVSRESIHERLPVVTILPLTSRKPGRRIFSTEVLIPGGIAGLSADSLAMAHQIRTLSKGRLGARLGEIPSGDLQRRLREAVRLYLDLD
ncbi:MAG: type II toxin-antitoxin system PemK/MazF family toxin [Candidatus Eremiobacterota bacterium]